jgi:hypothetical protein
VKKLKDMLVTRQYHAKISKGSAFSGNLDNNADINTAGKMLWRITIFQRKRVQVIVNRSRFDKEYTKLLH